MKKVAVVRAVALKTAQKLPSLFRPLIALTEAQARSRFLHPTLLPQPQTSLMSRKELAQLYHAEAAALRAATSKI